jgi:hypothetical protein
VETIFSIRGKGKGIFLFCKRNGQNLGLTHSAIQWVSGDISSRIKQAELQVTITPT